MVSPRVWRTNRATFTGTTDLLIGISKRSLGLITVPFAELTGVNPSHKRFNSGGRLW